MSETSEPAPGTHMTDEKGVTMVYVPAGKFLMGSTQLQVDEAFEQAKKEYSSAEKNLFTEEMPQHKQVIQHPFWLDLTPVTNESYARFVAEGGYRTRELWTPGGWKWVQDNKRDGANNSDGFTDPQQPRVGVTWFESYAYSCWRDGRLPTEAEWEWAARGPENRIYPWGNAFVSDYVVWRETSGGATAIVGDGIRSKGASWVGALDMSGNVWEWCSSLYKSYPYNESDGRESNEDPNNPRVLRGGSWFYFTFVARAAFRFWRYPVVEYNDRGFRWARSS